MTYSLRQKDGTQAVNYDKLQDNYLVLAESTDRNNISLFRTTDKDEARAVWEMTGGDYGDYEIVSDND